MANSKKDDNNVNTLLGTLQSDGITLVNIKINPVNGAMKVIDSSAGTYISRTNDLRDDNDVPAMLGVSSTDNKTPILVCADSNGNLLIKST